MIANKKLPSNPTNPGFKDGPEYPGTPTTAPTTPAGSGRPPTRTGTGEGTEATDGMHGRGPDRPVDGATGNSTTIMTNITRPGGGGAMPRVRDVEQRQVQDGELVENRIAGLLRSDSALSRLADIRGRREASRMGSSGGSYYGGAAQLAAQDIALPIAQQDASWVGQTARDNMGAVNERGMGELSSATSIATAGIGAESSMYSTDVDAQVARERMAADERLTLGERDWRSGESALDRTWQSNENDRTHEWQSREEMLGREDRNADREDRQAWEFAQREYDRAAAEHQFIRNLSAAHQQALMGAMATAYTNPNLTAAQAQAAVNNIVRSYRDAGTIAANMPAP